MTFEDYLVERTAPAVQRMLAERGPLSEDALLTALLNAGTDLGADPVETLADTMDSDDVGPLVVPLSDERWAYLPSLLLGRVFTHRLTSEEIESGFLRVSPDLEPLSVLTDSDEFETLSDGSPLVEMIGGVDDELLAERGISSLAADEAGFVLAPQRLRSLGGTDGDLVGMSVTAHGLVVSAVTAADEADAAGAVVRGLAEALEGWDEPRQIDDVVWTMCAGDAGLFARPLPPLGDMLEAAGLMYRGDQVVPAGFDFATYQLDNRIASMAEMHEIDEDSAAAVFVLVQLWEQVGDLLDAAEPAKEQGRLPSGLLDGRDAEDLPAPPDGVAAEETDVASDRALLSGSLEFIADAVVAEAFLTETMHAGRAGAAALGLFVETLESTAPRRTRAALRWLRGRAHERLGQTLDAEEAYEQALRADVDWVPALVDLARYASDRGHAERGLSLLRRAHADPDDDLVTLLRHFEVRPRTDIGRNQPCWCGSGRKYKVCHQRREQLPLSERAAWLYRKAGMQVSSGPWRDALLALAMVRAEHSPNPHALLEALQDPLVCDVVLFEGGAFAEFLDERGELLPEDERLLAEQWLLVERSVFEIETVRAGEGFTARDIRTGDRHDVRERTGSRNLEPGMLVCTRIAPAGDTMQDFGGIEIIGLRERDELVQLFDSGSDPEQIVAVLSARFAPPTLQNTEGDPLLLCATTFEVPEPEAMRSALDAAYGPGEDDEWFEHVTTHGMERIRASLRMSGDRLTVETNSAARQDRVLALLHGLQLGLSVVDEQRSAADDPTRAGASSPGGPVPLSPDDPAVAAARAEFVRDYERAWLNDSIPALAGATPRQAAQDPTRRPDLIRLLDSFPSHQPGGMDADRLREALGLS